MHNFVSVFDTNEISHEAPRLPAQKKGTQRKQETKHVLVYSSETLTDEQVALTWAAAPDRSGVKIIDSL